MSDGGEWCLIESDPGVFTELIKGFGAAGLECEEVYDLKETDRISDAVGLIFLFKWSGFDNDSSRAIRDAKSKGLFFAKQVITNACATQAIINILFNLDEKQVDIGDTLKQFKSFVSDFDSTLKGTALSNSDQIRAVHNSFRTHQLFEFDEKMPKKQEESYHFVGYLPVGGVVYELDGLKEGPVDHGSVVDSTCWIDAVRPVLESRMEKCVDGKFSLIAIVPDRLSMYQRQLLQLTRGTEERSSELIDELEKNIANERHKADLYRQENIRRRHNYLPLIVELLKILAENSRLVDMMDRAKTVACERKAAKATCGKK